MADLNNLSRLLQTEQIIFQGKETFDVWQDFPWLRQRPSDDQIANYQVTSATEGRPDLIANEIYGSPILGWVLIAFAARVSNDNTAKSALNWPKAGAIIEYPISSLVITSLIG